MQVRRADDSEAGAVHAILRAAFDQFRPQYTPGCFDATVIDAERVRRRMSEGPVFVAVHAGRIIGTVGVRLDDRGAYVRGLGVDPGARKQGVGHALMRACEDWARAQGAPVIWLSTTRFLADSIRLYHAMGYEDTRGPEDLFGVPLRSFEKAL